MFQIIAEKSHCKCSIFVVCLKWLFCLCQLAVEVGGKVVCFFENFFEGSCSFSGLFSSAVKDCRTQLYSICAFQPAPDLPSRWINAGALYGCMLTYSAVVTGSKPGIRRSNTDHVMKPSPYIIEKTEINLPWLLKINLPK